MSSPITNSLQRIPDQLGSLVLNEEGAVLSSSGELDNDERSASMLMNMTLAALRMQIPNSKTEGFKRLSVVYDTFMYVITVSNHKVYVVKRKYNPKEPVHT